MTSHRPLIPRATYRVQLHAGFSFDDAVRIVPYLADLGISHLYVSPILRAMPGSTHGYDVVDHGRVNEELGGEAGFDRLIAALDGAGMGLVLDIVPNHMAIGGEENRWWADVLEHGPASRYAAYFDVDWDPPESRLRNVVLLPVLPDHYGRVLESGSLELRRCGGRIAVEHAGRRYPIDPVTLGPLVRRAGARAESDELASIGRALTDLPRSTDADPARVARRQRDADALRDRLEAAVADDTVAAALDAEVAALNADVDALDRLLDAQNFRLALWRSAARDLGYRRFFDVDQLIGLRVEDERVFAAVHELPLRWVAEGRIAGLRIDHPDGLRDPAGYAERLRAAAPDAWILAEKILEPHEELPTAWPLDGTTGYRFANLALGVAIDPGAERPMTELWASVADVGPNWDEVAAGSRRDVLTEVLGSDVNRLSDLFLAVCEANRRYRDFTRHEVHEALREVAASMPVYRTYVRAEDAFVSEEDAVRIAQAVDGATHRRPDLDPDLFAFLGRILRLDVPGTLAAELAMRFQQLTPAAMAKGVEDTAFYRHHRLVALNEVGGDPGRFGTSPDEFHEAMTRAAQSWPQGMNALSTHDTKRGADVRARLAVLTEDPAGWRSAVDTLRAAARPHRAGPDAPTDADVLLLLQTLVGAWPIDADRAAAYMAKATREAKLRTSWTAPDAAYDAAVETCVRGVLADATFVAELERFVDGIVDAGHRVGLAQLAVQLTAPGVPDLYQGTELWDRSLVDPDNRRPVDYDARRLLLDEVSAMDSEAAWRRRAEGMPKLWLIRRVLELRRRRPEVFADGSYRPVAAVGPARDSVLAFARGDAVITVTPRLVRTPGAAGWDGTRLELPEGHWVDLDRAQHAGTVTVDRLFVGVPVAVLERVA